MPSGGCRPEAGRHLKNINDKKPEGKFAKPTVSSAPAPKKVYSKNMMAHYFSMVMKECEKEVRRPVYLRIEIEEYIAARGCEDFIAPQTVTDYVLKRHGFLICECLNRKIGRMTKDLKLSPYVTAGQGYCRQCATTSI